MKNSTKRKIINWVTKVLKYQEPINLPIEKHERRIQEVRWERFFKDEEMVRMYPEEMKFIIYDQIIKEIKKADCIHFTERKELGGCVVSAMAQFIKPIVWSENVATS